MVERLDRLEKQTANHDEQDTDLEHGLATAQVAQRHDEQVHDESFDRASRPHLVMACARDSISAASLLDVVNKLVREKKPDAEAVTLANTGQDMRFQMSSCGEAVPAAKRTSYFFGSSAKTHCWSEDIQHFDVRYGSRSTTSKLEGIFGTRSHKIFELMQ